MIEGSLHPEPDTIDSSETGKDPECSLGYPPPPIDRLQFVDPHDRVGENVEDEEKDSKCKIHDSKYWFQIIHFSLFIFHSCEAGCSSISLSHITQYERFQE